MQICPVIRGVPTVLKESGMRTIMIAVLLCLMGFPMAATAGEKAPKAVVDLANGKLAALGMDETIVKAVVAQNAKGMTMADIKAMDDKWRADAGLADYMKALMENDCAKFLHSVQDSAAYYSEIFVMDNQGANVCQTDKTSDYWQGDEAKFQKSFNGGAGAVFVDEVEFDDSAQAYLVQVSVPVMRDGEAIGAITYGINVDAIQ